MYRRLVQQIQRGNNNRCRRRPLVVAASLSLSSSSSSSLLSVARATTGHSLARTTTTPMRSRACRSSSSSTSLVAIHSNTKNNRRYFPPHVTSSFFSSSSSSSTTLRHAFSTTTTTTSSDDEDQAAADNKIKAEEKERLRHEMEEQARLLEQVESAKDAEEAIDRLLVDEGVQDIDEREMERLKKKYPDDLSDAELDKLFKDDLKQSDYMGIDPNTNQADPSPKYSRSSGGAGAAAKAAGAAATGGGRSVIDHTDDDEDEEEGDNPLDDDQALFAEPEVEIPQGDKMSFQAETRQLLDIVTNSIYTDKEVFLRELVSNASDALEKLRHLQTSNKVSSTIDTELPLEIRIDTDEVSSTVTITDTGVGMTRAELISNLGTIARSGSRQYVQQLKADTESTTDGSGIIGKFGVGFYSAFMVGRKVEVRSRSVTSPDQAHVWSSDGSGEFEIVQLPDGIRQDRGSSLIIHLKDEYWEYASEAKLEKILKRYSNFVAFPIVLNGKRVNTLQAIWVQDPKTVQPKDYTAFFKFIHPEAVDEPFDTYHFRADAPLDVKALFFIPPYHSEKHGMGRMESGVSLYCRKVLIESKSKDIVPDWMRFVKGVVDSEDLPLSISREKPQDSALIAKLRTTLVRKFISHLLKMAKKEPERYVQGFYNEYNFFLKEGVCQDKDFATQIAKLLRFESSHSLDPYAEPGQHTMISMDEYVSRMRPEQKDIYFLIAPTRDAALNSPYLEAFESAGVEVLIAFSSIDEFAMANLEKYEGRKLVSVESGEVNLKDLKKDKSEGDKTQSGQETVPSLSASEALEFCEWFKNELGEEKVTNCTVSERLTTSPALVVDNEASGYRRMMRVIGTNSGEEEPLGGQSVEINAKHPIIRGVYALRDQEPVLAATIAEQIFDNCLLAAGLMDDGRSMIPRLNGILESVIKTAMPPPPSPPPSLSDGTTTTTSATSSSSSSSSTTPVEVVDFDEYTPQADTVDMDAIEAEIVNKSEPSSSSSSK